MKRGTITIGWLLAAGLAAAAQDPKPEFNAAKALDRGVEILLERQHKDGSWGRKSTFGLDRNIRATVTLFCIEALETVPSPGENVRKALDRARKYVLANANEIPGRPSYQMYDFSFYSGAYGLDYFSALSAREKKYSGSVRSFLKTVKENQRKQGGYSYTWRSRFSDTYEGFCSAIVILSLLEARKHGIEVEDGLFDRTLESIEQSRLEQGYFGYHIVEGKARGSYSGNGRLAREGCLVRTVVSEYALVRAGKGDKKLLKRAVGDFFKHREELEKVRKKDRHTHQGDFDNAPYYFLFGHYYAARSLEHLDPDTRIKGREALARMLREIREEDGAWFDSRITGKAYGTAMGMLILHMVSRSEY